MFDVFVAELVGCVVILVLEPPLLGISSFEVAQEQEVAFEVLK